MAVVCEIFVELDKVREFSEEFNISGLEIRFI